MAFKLFRKEKRLPTLLGILILLLGVISTAYLTQRVQLFFLEAGPTVFPQNVQITNVGPGSFSVSWITTGNPLPGYVKYGKSASFGKIAMDERDQNIETLGKYVVHHTNVVNLDPSTTYYFELVSEGKEYDQNGSPYTVKTTDNLPSSSLTPTYGVVLEENGQTASEGIVYVTVGSSNRLSALIKPSGNWLIALSPLLNHDLKGALEIQPEDAEEIFVQGREKTSKAITSLSNNAPVPAITLGKDYDFRQTTSPSPTPQATTQAPVSPVFDLTAPASEAAIPGQPFFKGTGTPGNEVQIEVESEDAQSGKVVVDKNGVWSWQAPRELAPGEHTVTATITNQEGKLQTIIRKFIILPGGSQVVEAATPSATPTLRSTPTPTLRVTLTPSPTLTLAPTPTIVITPTPTHISSPTPTPKLNLTPTPTSTSTPPESGDLLFTLILAFGGFTFLGAGLFFRKQAA
ncbi:MAG: fibronectin type III domain-containing protein [bacterium]|nr:fibronectin type III domain-containing protein [bacterium]